MQSPHYQAGKNRETSLYFNGQTPCGADRIPAYPARSGCESFQKGQGTWLLMRAESPAVVAVNKNS